jgi:hypothetical protein
LKVRLPIVVGLSGCHREKHSKKEKVLFLF